MSSGKSRIGWLTMALVFATGACLAVAPSAGAAELLIDDGDNEFIFVADTGEADAVQVSPGSSGRVLISDSADTIELTGDTTGCTGGGTTQVDCPIGANQFLEMFLQDLDDVAVVFETVGMSVALHGSGGNDSLDGGVRADTIDGGSGNDPTLSGGGGNDTIEPGPGPDGAIDGGPGDGDLIDYDDGRPAGVTVNLETGTTSDGETLSGIEHVSGSSHDDMLQGTAGENQLEGRAGADVLIGGGAQDTLAGGTGSNDDGAPDTASYSERSTPVVTSLASGSTSTHQDFDLYLDISNLAGGGGNDVLTGDGLANVLTGNGGTDMLFGGAGVDTLHGNDGDDELFGESEVDTLNGNDGNDVLTGGLDDDTIDGGLDDDTLLGGSGADDLLGGGNFDTVSYQDGRVTGIALDLGAGALPDSDTYTAIDSVVGTEQVDTMTGGPGADDLRGAGGGDTITGAAGIDTLQAQDGDDTVRAKDGEADTVGCGAGADQVEADGADSQSECETQLGIQPQPPGDPGGGGTQAGGGAGALASVAGLGITGAFQSAGRGASIAAPVGGRVTYRLSEAARVTFTVRRLVAGRRRGRRCVRASPRLRRARRCTRQLRVRGSFTHSGKAGANSFRFTGRLRGRRLRPGRYLLVAVPVDSDGRRGAQRTAPFRIVRR
jgi:Ca2+-binding RTX toxin-like protein